MSVNVVREQQPAERCISVPKQVADQIADAYVAMSDKARYRPSAPSDGMGNIIGPLNLEKEQAHYSKRWWAEEDSLSFWVGCRDFRTRAAVIYAVEAIRNLNAGVDGHECGLKALQMAVEHVKPLVK